MNARKVLVTGGAGFIGSTLVKGLVSNGDHVRIIDNLWRGSLDNLRLADGQFAVDLKTHFVQADLEDYSKCLEFIRDVDLVYHLADVVAGIDFVFGHEAFIFRQNLLINTNVLSACVLNGVPNYVYVGTACSYPKHLQMRDGVVALLEDQAYPAEPESAYGWSKLMGEYEAELALKSGSLNIGLLRLHNVYGPGASFEKTRSQVIPSLILRSIEHEEGPFIVWGSGQQYRDFVYVDDVIEALLLVSQHGMNKGVIQIGSGIPITVRELAEKIVSVSGKKIAIVFDMGKPEGDRGRIAICERARSILGWKPTTTFDTGINSGRASG